MAELDRPPAAGRDWNIFAGGCLYIPIQFQESAPPDPDASQIRNRADTLFMCFALESRASRPTCRARQQRPPAGRDRLDPVRTCEGCVRSDSSGQAAKFGGRIWRQNLLSMDQNLCGEPAAGTCGRQGRRQGQAWASSCREHRDRSRGHAVSRSSSASDRYVRATRVQWRKARPARCGDVGLGRSERHAG